LCYGLRDQSLQACTIQHRSGKRGRHLKRMSDCRWKNDDRLHYSIIQSSHESLHSIRTCQLAESDGEWLYVTIGPVLSFGGQSWETLVAVFSDSLLPHQQMNGAWVVSDYVLGSSTAHGELIGHPPLHQHHFHLFFASNLNNMVLNNHGDSDCRRSEEGVYCQLMEFPPEYSFWLSPRVGIFASVNDVRAHNSTPLASLFFSGLKLMSPNLTSSTRPLTMLNIYLAPTVFLHPLPIQYPPYPVDTTKESVMWRTLRLRHVDTIISGWWHLHRGMVDRAWLLSGDPSTLGLDSGHLALGNETFDSSPGAIMRYKHAISKLDASRHLCQTGDEIDFLKFRRHWCQFQKPSTDSYTIVGIYKAREPNLSSTYSMHLNVYLIVSTATNKPTNATTNWARSQTYDTLLSHLISFEYLSQSEVTPRQLGIS